MTIPSPPVAASNISKVALPPLARIFFSGFSNASITQRITINVDGKDLAVFTGQGENTPMKHSSGGKNPEVFELPLSCDKRQCTAKFEYAPDAGAPPKPSQAAGQVEVGDASIRSISINSTEGAPKDDDNDSQLKIDMVFSSKTNPTHIRIPKNTNVQISCMANAAQTQHVSWWIKDDENTRGIFTGNGENKAMQIEVKGKKETSITLHSAKYDRTLIGVFAVVQSSGDKKPAKKVTKPTVIGNDMSLFTTVGAEDGSDKDNNDAVLRVVAMSVEYSDEED